MAALDFGSGHWLAIRPATLFRKIGKRTSVARNFFELGKKRAEQIFTEAGANFAGKLEFCTLVKANQDCAEILPGSFRFRVSLYCTEILRGFTVSAFGSITVKMPSSIFAPIFVRSIDGSSS
jgi:hypothetical protein